MNDIKKFLPAIDTLINHYKQFSKNEKPRSCRIKTTKLRPLVDACPLCIEAAPNKIIDCNICPWVIFEKYDCIDPKSPLGGETTAQCLKRLRRWKKNIKRRK